MTQCSRRLSHNSNSPASHVVVDDESGEEKKRPSRTPFFSARASETKVFHKVENSVLISLGRGWSVPRDKKILTGSSSLKNSVSQSEGSTNPSSGG